MNINDVFGSGEELSARQMAARAVVMFFRREINKNSLDDVEQAYIEKSCE